MKFDIELVGKVGSMALVNQEHDDIDYNIIARISRDLKPGVIWVTSGAAEIGRLDYVKRNGHDLVGEYDEIKADYAAQGQSILMSNYRQFADSRFSLRQILIEHNHFNDPAKREHLKNMLLRCPAQGAIPIVNYNDPVSDEEVRTMEISALKKAGVPAVECVDNDETASQIACLVKPRYLVILTGVGGIYTDKDDENTLIREIYGNSCEEVIKRVEEVQRYCNGASRKGANGAHAKLEYIKEPLKNGTTVFIANSRYRVKDILTGDVPCTKIYTK